MAQDQPIIPSSFRRAMSKSANINSFHWPKSMRNTLLLVLSPMDSSRRTPLLATGLSQRPPWYRLRGPALARLTPRYVLWTYHTCSEQTWYRRRTARAGYTSRRGLCRQRHCLCYPESPQADLMQDPKSSGFRIYQGLWFILNML